MTNQTKATKPTKGPCVALNGVVLSMGIKVADCCTVDIFSRNEDEVNSNAELFADALNVFNETSLTPRELKEQRDALLKIVKMDRDASACNGPGNEAMALCFYETYGFKWYDWQAKEGRIKAAIAAAEGKATGEKDEGKV